MRSRTMRSRHEARAGDRARSRSWFHSLIFSNIKPERNALAVKKYRSISDWNRDIHHTRLTVSRVASALTGCLLGQALGDALGFVVEARPFEVARRYVDHYLRAGRAGDLAHPEFGFGQYSDDTQLARELLLSVVEAGEWSPEKFA